MKLKLKTQQTYGSLSDAKVRWSELIKYCKCGVQIPEARLKILPNTHTCVNCSDVQTKKPVIVQRGQGDHTYTETVVLDHEEYVKYVEEENKFKKRMSSGLDIPNM